MWDLYVWLIGERTTQCRRVRVVPHLCKLTLDIFYHSCSVRPFCKGPTVKLFSKLGRNSTFLLPSAPKSLCPKCIRVSLVPRRYSELLKIRVSIKADICVYVYLRDLCIKHKQNIILLPVKKSRGPQLIYW